MFFGPFLLKYFGSPYRWLLITRLPTQESSLSLLCAAQQVFCEKFQIQFWIEYSREHYKFLAIPFNSTKTFQPLTSRTFLWLLDPTGLWEGRFFKTSAYPHLYHLFTHKPIDTLVSSIQSVWPGNQDCVQVILEVLFVTELVSVKSKILGGEHFEALPDGVFVVAGFTLFPCFLSHT